MPESVVFTAGRSFEEFCSTYHSEEICADALFQARWPDGFRCPACGHPHFYRITTRRLPLFECVSCRHQTSIIAGTVIEGSSTLLVRWFQAIYLLAQPGGISSSRLSLILEVTYKAAWLISHKLRHAMRAADRSEPLEGDVQVQPFEYGSILFPDNKQPLLIGASKNDQDELQAVKIKQPLPKHVDNEERRIRKTGLDAFVREHAAEANVTHLPRISKTIETVFRIKSGVCHWLNDTFNGIGPKHLQAYLDEFVFRFQGQWNDKDVFTGLLSWCAGTKTIVYKELTKERPVLPAPWRAFGSRSKWRGQALRNWTA